MTTLDNNSPILQNQINDSTSHSKAKGSFSGYNFFFHPSKCGENKAFAVITNIALTILTLGAWQIPFWIVNQMDKENAVPLNKAESSVPSKKSPVNQDTSSRNHRNFKDDSASKVDVFRNLPKKMRMQIAKYPKKDEITGYVQRFMFPYLTGEITQENENNDRTPLMELIYQDVIKSSTQQLQADEANLIQEIAFQAFIMEAVKIFMRNNKGVIFSKIPSNELKNMIIPEVKRVMKKDFPGCKFHGRLSSRINESFKIYMEQQKEINDEATVLIDQSNSSNGLPQFEILKILTEQDALFTDDLK